MSQFAITFGPKSAFRDHFVIVNIVSYDMNYRNRNMAGDALEPNTVDLEWEGKLAGEIACEHFGETGFSAVYSMGDFNRALFPGGALCIIQEQNPQLISVQVPVREAHPEEPDSVQSVMAYLDDCAEHYDYSCSEETTSTHTLRIWLMGYKAIPPQIDISTQLGQSACFLAGYQAFKQLLEYKNDPV